MASSSGADMTPAWELHVDVAGPAKDRAGEVELI